MNLAFWAIFSFALSLTLTEIVRRWAVAKGVVHRPRADRWSNRVVAMEGGVGFISAFIIAAMIVVNFVPISGVALKYFSVLLGGAVILMITGVIDDLRHMEPRLKFLIQILMAVALVWAGARLSPGSESLWIQMMTVIYIVGITNAFNLIDNMDGVSAGGATVSSMVILGLSLFAGVEDQGWTALVISLGACTFGFFVLNFPPAKIFMGDAGSLPMGFLLSGLFLPNPFFKSGWLLADSSDFLQTYGVIGPIVLLSVLFWHPIFDTTFVTLRRSLAGKPFYVGGRDHTTHELAFKGLSVRGVLFSYLGLSTAIGALTFLIVQKPIYCISIFCIVAGFSLLWTRFLLGAKPVTLIDNTLGTIPQISSPQPQSMSMADMQIPLLNQTHSHESQARPPAA